MNGRQAAAWVTSPERAEALDRLRAAIRDGGKAMSQPPVRFCPMCRLGGDDDSPLELDVVFNVEGAGPEGVAVETCKRGHLYPVDQDDEAAEAAERGEGDG